MERVLYIAGKMTGVDNFNHPAFEEAERMLREKGFKVINPSVLPTDLPKEMYMPICLAMVDQCDGIALLPRWDESEGARIEYLYGQKCGKTVLPLSNWLCKEREDYSDTLVIALRDGTESMYFRDEYDTCEYNTKNGDTKLVVKRGEKWIGIYPIDSVKSVEVR